MLSVPCCLLFICCLLLSLLSPLSPSTSSVSVSLCLLKAHQVSPLSLFEVSPQLALSPAASLAILCSGLYANFVKGVTLEPCKGKSCCCCCCSCCCCCFLCCCSLCCRAWDSYSLEGLRRILCLGGCLLLSVSFLSVSFLSVSLFVICLSLLFAASRRHPLHYH